MRVSFERSGGFTGIPMTTTIDTASLSPTEASHLRTLVEAAGFFQLPSAAPATAQPDRFQYQLTVEDNGKQHTVTVGESSMPGTLRPLVEWLMEAIRRR